MALLEEIRLAIRSFFDDSGLQDAVVQSKKLQNVNTDLDKTLQNVSGVSSKIGSRIRDEFNSMGQAVKLAKNDADEFDSKIQDVKGVGGEIGGRVRKSLQGVSDGFTMLNDGAQQANTSMGELQTFLGETDSSLTRASDGTVKLRDNVAGVTRELGKDGMQKTLENASRQVRGFRFDFLSWMFVLQMVSGALTGMLRPAADAAGLTEEWGDTMKELLLPIMELMVPLVESMGDVVDDMSRMTKLLIGGFIVLAAIVLKVTSFIFMLRLATVGAAQQQGKAATTALSLSGAYEVLAKSAGKAAAGMTAAGNAARTGAVVGVSSLFGWVALLLALIPATIFVLKRMGFTFSELEFNVSSFSEELSDLAENLNKLPIIGALIPDSALKNSNKALEFVMELVGGLDQIPDITTGLFTNLATSLGLREGVRLGEKLKKILNDIMDLDGAKEKVKEEAQKEATGGSGVPSFLSGRNPVFDFIAGEGFDLGTNLGKEARELITGGEVNNTANVTVNAETNADEDTIASKVEEVVTDKLREWGLTGLANIP